MIRRFFEQSRLWLRQNPARFVAWLSLLALLWSLIDGQFAQGFVARRGETEQLGLLLLVFLLAMWLQHTASGARRTLPWIWSQLRSNLVQLAASILLLGLLWALIDSQFGGSFVARPGESDQLLLIAAILAVAVFLQYGTQLLDRLKKIGPVELFAKEAGPLLKALGELNIPEDSPTRKPLSADERFHYDQANLLISNLQFSNVERSGLASSRDLHAVLLRLGGLAHDQGEWAKATDRLELLLKLSVGGYEPCETYYRCSNAYKEWAESYDEQDREQNRKRKKLFKRALDLTEEALAKHKNDYRLYFVRAYAQDELGMYEAAIASNEAAGRLRRGRLAAAKYNKTIAQINNDQYEEAWETLKRIEKGDEGFDETMATAWDDPELKPLRNHPDYRTRMREWFKAKSATLAEPA